MSDSIKIEMDCSSPETNGGHSKLGGGPDPTEVPKSVRFYLSAIFEMGRTTESFTLL
jgi:hypothetical protein